MFFHMTPVTGHSEVGSGRAEAAEVETCFANAAATCGTENVPDEAAAEEATRVKFLLGLREIVGGSAGGRPTLGTTKGIEPVGIFFLDIFLDIVNLNCFVI